MLCGQNNVFVVTQGKHSCLVVTITFLIQGDGNISPISLRKKRFKHSTRPRIKRGKKHAISHLYIMETACS